MIAQVFQHVAFEDIGSMREWLAVRDYEVRYTRFFAGETPPDLDSYNFLIVMGGPMSVLEEERYPWLAAEKRAVLATIASGKPVLGVCLGAQLMASALGADIRRNPVKEIGWFPVAAVPTEAHAFAFPAEIPVFHWHGETFDMPAQAIRLAQSEHCRNQAFQFGAKAIGLQFHLETTPETVQIMVDNCGEELVAGVPTIQSAQEMLGCAPAYHQGIANLLHKILEYLLYHHEKRLSP
jgi:GMP synthase-like glutamine amidotransferase